MIYVPILRLKPVELKILGRIPTSGTFPLLEIVDQKTFGNVDNVKKRFDGGVMMEIPRHLMQSENKHYGGVMSIFQSMGGNNFASLQTDFYKKYKDKIDIPVVSSLRSDIPSYKDLVDGFDDIKDNFSKITVRIFVTPVDIDQSTANKESLESLAGFLREGDVILLDVVSFDGMEPHVMKNLKKIIHIMSKCKSDKIFVLNAFDYDGNWRKDTHDYAPLIAKHFKLSGFGDLATIPRIEASGGVSTTTSVIRFFSPWDMDLINFKSDSFLHVKRDLISSQLWKKSVAEGHFKSCVHCQEIAKKDTEWKTFWKFFRIEHHINCMVNQVLPNFMKFNNPQDFDITGSNKIFKKAG